jgi:peptide methionine sulfoxide reductase msrA/msrB
MTFSRTLQGMLLALCTSFLLSACAKETSAGKPTKSPASLGAPVDSIVLGMGCFWGAEKRMAEIPGVMDVESGYANGDIEGSYWRYLPRSAPCAPEKTNGATMPRWSR